MTTTATFSNGYTDTYKGSRDVTAAWVIVRKSDGKVLGSGHSLDAIKARKTAEGHLRENGVSVLGLDSPYRAEMWVGGRMTRAETAAAKAHNAKRLEMIRAGVEIEVVAL